MSAGRRSVAEVSNERRGSVAGSVEKKFVLLVGKFLRQLPIAVLVRFA